MTEMPFPTVRALAFRFEAFGRPVRTAMIKKFEEGVFSDLRNLKPGEDASMENPKASTIHPFSLILAKHPGLGFEINNVIRRANF